MTVQLPPTVPARTARTPRAAKTAKKPSDFNAYREAQANARSALGYDNSSPIWGKTTLEILQIVFADLDAWYSAVSAGTKNAANPDLVHAHEFVQNLLTRELADVTGKEAYRNR